MCVCVSMWLSEYVCADCNPLLIYIYNIVHVIDSLLFPVYLRDYQVDFNLLHFVNGFFVVILIILITTKQQLYMYSINKIKSNAPKLL